MNIKLPKLRILTLAVLIGLTAQLILLSYSKITSAESTISDISWSNAKPTIFSSTPTEISGSTSCSSSYQIKQVAGDDSLSRVCMVSGTKLRYGVDYGHGASVRSLVGFNFDTKMYPLYGVCDGFEGCLYIPQSDIMIAKHSGPATAIYRNFSEHIKPVTSTHYVPSSTGGITVITTVDYYEFDSSTTPDAVLQNTDGSPWPIGGASVSANGDWVAIEFGQRGIGLINMQTLEIKRVSDISLSYYPIVNYYYSPSVVELAVSNDGNHIAAVGSKTSPVIIDVTPDCSEVITDASMSVENYPMAHRCKQAQIDTTEFITNFQYALDPRFDDAGGELSFYAISNITTHTTNDPETDIQTNANQIVMRVQGYTKQRIDYLALGDSFSSGEGELEDKNYQDGTNDEYEKCHVSTLSYPFLIANGLGNKSTFKSVACSGAKTTDIIGNNDALYLGQGKRLKDAGMSSPIMTVAKDQAEKLFIPGRIHQQKFVSEYKPKVITVGVGGNDAGFMDKLEACIKPGVCEWANTPHGRYQTAGEVNNLFNTLVTTYAALHAASPNTKIYAIGYPQIVDSTDNCRLAYWWLGVAETKFMSEGIKYLNQVVAAAAKAAGVKYIDIEQSYGDQKLCGSKKPTAANEIVYGDDFNPINNTWIKFVGDETFHPNSEGHQLAFEAIDNALTGGDDESTITIMNDPNYCSNNLTICPDPTVTAPPTPAYWIPPAGYDSEGNLVPIYDDYVDQLDSSPLSKGISLGKSSLAPSSSITVELHSDPIVLGQFQAASDGSFNANITLPDDLEEGYHTIHLYGTSYSGEPVDIYQIFDYEKPYTKPDIQPQVPANTDTIINTDTTTTAKNTTADNAAITNTTTDTTKTKPDKTVATASSTPEIDNSSITDQLGSPIALVTSQTVKSDVSTDKAPESARTEGKKINNSKNTSVYVIVGVLGAVVVIVSMICLVKRLRSVKK